MRGGIGGSPGAVSFEPDLDRGLRRCEEALLDETVAPDDRIASWDGVPPGLFRYIERVPVAEGSVLLHQNDPSGDIYVLAEGRLAVEISTPEGKRVRLRTLGPGVVVGEVALYTGAQRTADVVAEIPVRGASMREHGDRAHGGTRPRVGSRAPSLARRHAGRSAERHDAHIRRAPGLGEDLLTSRRAQGWPTAIAAGVIIGAVETVLAVAFAALVFGGLLWRNLPDGIGLYLAAAALTLGTLAWRAGRRGVVGSVQDAAAAVLAVAAGAAAARAKAIQEIADAAGLTNYKAPDVFLTVIAATLVVTVLCGVVFLVLGRGGWGNVIRFVPYPVIGGFLAGTGWLLLTGGIYVASKSAGRPRQDRRPGGHVPIGALAARLRVRRRAVDRGADRWQAAGDPGDDRHRAGGVRRDRAATGSGLDEVRRGGWLLGPFETTRLWQPWTLRAVGGADWASVAASWPVIATAVFVAALALLFNVGGTELVLDRDLDTNEELRDAGVLNVVSGVLGGIPGYHALSLTALAARMNVDARRAGLIAALVPLTAVVAGASVVELIPRSIVGGVLVFLGLAFIVDWVWDKRKTLSRMEYLVVLAVLGVVIARGYLEGIVVGLVFALVLSGVQLRAGGSGSRGDVRRHVPQQRRPFPRPASGASSAARPGADPARQRVRVLRIDGPSARGGSGPGWGPRHRGSW